MIDLTDPNSTGVREVLHAHAHDIDALRPDLVARVESRALALRRRRAAALSGGVVVVVVAAVSPPLALAGRSTGSRIQEQPPAASASAGPPVTAVVDTDPTTWPFRGDASVRDALVPAAATAMARLDESARYRVSALSAGTGPYGDRYLAFLGLPADDAKSIAFGVYQQPTSGPGFLIQPYDIGAAGRLDVKTLDLALRTGSISYVAILGAPDAAGFRIVTRNGSAGTTTQSCANFRVARGVALCPGGDVTTDQVQQLDAQGRVVDTVPVHSDRRD